MYKEFRTDSYDDWSDFEMRLNEKRESAKIIQFPLNRRFETHRPDVAQVVDPRAATALDPAWYHMDAIDAPAPVNPPKH